MISTRFQVRNAFGTFNCPKPSTAGSKVWCFRGPSDAAHVADPWELAGQLQRLHLFVFCWGDPPPQIKERKWTGFLLLGEPPIKEMNLPHPPPPKEWREVGFSSWVVLFKTTKRDKGQLLLVVWGLVWRCFGGCLPGRIQTANLNHQLRRN